jgi:F-type H+-transporting ATPase subunit b
MMGTFLFLAEAHSEGGFGINFDIFETNLINLAILVGVLFYYGKGIVGNILSERRTKIEEQIKEIEAMQKEAASAVAEQEKKLAQAKVEAEKIRQEATANAEKLKASILAQGEQEVAKIKATAMQDLNSEQERAIAQLRQRAAALAMAKVEAQLGSILDDSAQTKLIDRSIAQLGGR